MDERELDRTQAGDGPGAAGVDMERLREIKLMGFLRELDRQEGRMATAALLGVNYKTVARALDEDRVTGRMADALELLLGAGGDSELERLRQQVRLLAERVAALEERGDVLPVAPVVGGDLDGDGVGGDSGGGDDGGVEQEQASAQPGDVNGGASSQQPPAPTAPPVAGLGVSKPARRRRVDPELVTREPAEDDPEVYGDAWPLVAQWRELKARHPVQGRRPVLADRPRAAANAGARHAGGARPDPAAVHAAGEGPGPPGPHPLALEGAVPNAGGDQETQAAALAAPVAHPVGVAELGGAAAVDAGFDGMVRRLENTSEPPASAGQAITGGADQVLAKPVP